MSAVQIRRAVADEAEKLSEIAWNAKAHWGYGEAMMNGWRDGLRFTAELIERWQVDVAIVDSAIAGVTALSFSDEMCEIEHLWVRPDRMGLGVGRALFEHAARAARRADASHLEVASDPHAEGFYVAMGMRRVGEIASTPPGRRIPHLRVDLT